MNELNVSEKVRRYSAHLVATVVFGLIFFGVSVTSATSVEAGEGMRGPSAGTSPRLPLKTVSYYWGAPRLSAQHRVGTGVLRGLLGFYRTVVSPVDGDRCSMAPTCSLYSRQALQEQGVFWGVLLTADRLLHEADETSEARKVVTHGETYYLDPIENNTYWLD